VEDAIRDASGAGHQGDHKPKYLGEKTVAHCAACQEVVNFETGMHLMITSEWRIHIACFAEVLERHYKDGEVIDLTTGTIRQLREDDP
jgi:hypothetical protein